MATRERSYHQAKADAHACNTENRHGYYRNPFETFLLMEMMETKHHLGLLE